MTHDDRLRAIRSAFTEASQRLADRLEALDEASATTAPPTGWNPAQIGCHVAITNEFLANVLSGGVPGLSAPRPPDFAESLATTAFPDKIQTFPQLEPPASTSREEALARLRVSRDVFAKAIESVTPDRASSAVVRMPFGVCSLYEIGEFTAAHIRRHIGQLNRTVGHA